MNSIKSVLVVGGAGYLGSVLTPLLVESGYEVLVLDRCFFGVPPFGDTVKLYNCDMRGDFRMNEVDAVVNIGGLSNDPTAEFNEDANYALNTDAAISLAERAKAQGVKRYIYASSASLYDIGNTDEELDIIYDENSPLPEPTRPYSRSKYLAEQGLFNLSDETFAVTCLRKGTLFGQSPRMRYDLVVNAFVKDALATGVIRLYDGGMTWRPLVGIYDAARAYLAMLTAPVEQIAGQVFNVVDRNWRISELALTVQAILNDRAISSNIASVAGGAVRNYRVSGKKLRETTGWEPQTTVKQEVINMAAFADDPESLNFYQGVAGLYHPRYYNIDWMKLLEETRRAHGLDGSIFDRRRG